MWATLWRLFHGNNAAIAATTKIARLGMHAKADVTLDEEYVMLPDKGYKEVGQPDRLMGSRSLDAIRAIRAENGLAAGDKSYNTYAAALAAAGGGVCSRECRGQRARSLRQRRHTGGGAGSIRLAF